VEHEADAEQFRLLISECDTYEKTETRPYVNLGEYYDHNVGGVCPIRKPSDVIVITYCFTMPKGWKSETQS
jgi:hypothetical protein